MQQVHNLKYYKDYTRCISELRLLFIHRQYKYVYFDEVFLDQIFKLTRFSGVCKVPSLLLLY